MSLRHPSTTAFDLYREQLRDTPTCAKCGFTDSGGTWQTAYRERRLVYRHICPRCGAIDRREFRFDRGE